MIQNQSNEAEPRTNKLVISINNMSNKLLDVLKNSTYSMDVFISDLSSQESVIVLSLSECVSTDKCYTISNEFLSEIGISNDLAHVLVGGDVEGKFNLDDSFIHIKKKGKKYLVKNPNDNKLKNQQLLNLSLPQFTNLYQMNKCNLYEREEVIEGMARTSNVGLLTAVSKAGKSQCMIELAVVIASGGKWFDKLRCSCGKVLFVNLELDDFNFRKRFNEVLDSLKIQNREEVEKNIDLLNCRGFNITYRDLEELILEKTKNTKYKLIIIDPIYVIGDFDENSAEQVGEFMRRLIVLAEKTNSLVFITHHSSKGDKSKVSAIDRGSGSGSFARAVDILIDMSSIDASKVLDVQSDNFFRIESTLRNYPNAKPFEIEYSYPIHYAVNGLGEAPLSYGKKSNKQSDYDFDIEKSIAIVGTDLNRISEYLNVSNLTIRNRLKKSKKFMIENNQIYVKENI